MKKKRMTRDNFDPDKVLKSIPRCSHDEAKRLLTEACHVIIRHEEYSNKFLNNLRELYISAWSEKPVEG